MITTPEVLRDEYGNYTVEGKKYPSVTTILRTASLVGLDQGLGYVFGTWTAKEAAKIIDALKKDEPFYRPAGFEIENGRVVKQYEPLDIRNWNDIESHLARVGRRELDCAADRGTLVHLTAQLLARGEDIQGSDVLSQYSEGLWPGEDTEGYLDAIIAWWHMVNPEPIASEISGFSTVYEYAGTIDLVARIDGQVYLIDFKTSSQYQVTHLMQLAAYRMMDYWFTGKEVIEPEPGLFEAPCLEVMVKPDSVKPYLVQPETVRKWEVMFRKMLDLHKGWSVAKQFQIQNNLVWKAF